MTALRPSPPEVVEVDRVLGRRPTSILPHLRSGDQTCAQFVDENGSNYMKSFENIRSRKLLLKYPILDHHFEEIEPVNRSIQLRRFEDGTS